MNNYVIGLDPDSDKPGVAVYKNGKLIAVKSLGLFNLMDLLSGMKTDGSIHAHIENVCANNARFKKGGVKNARAATAINRSIGMVQQSQRNLEEMLNHLGIGYTLHSIDSKWKSQKGKREFELVTGWKGQSNEDSRSAAYFGFLGVRNGNTKPC
ncbi:hypothetical protein [Vibrio diazotrophicus]|uniref:hypothetical protein n=1 Tax=Vibrio diazotrophicus TaxID=685 RepID=UPI000C9EB3B2|nr:hypothetical protein [Vibrio diazotrophicus]PNH94075.1 hypothetical protein C1M59_04940 [Vibrio diazotrophicus]